MNKLGKFEGNSRFLTWFMPVLLVALAAGCGSSGDRSGRDPILGTGATLGGAGAVPVVPPVVPAAPVVIVPGAVCSAAVAGTPTVTSSNPTSAALNVTTSTAGVPGSGKLITATFSVAMSPATINSATAPLTFTLKTTAGSSVAGTVVLNAAGTVATFTTAAALAANTSYTATITQAATSVPGIPLACIYAWSFTTGPVAVGVAPINLGVAAPFALASAGGITNAGATKINGDVVLDPNQTCNAVAVGAGNDFGACGGVALNVPTHNAGDRVITQIFPDTTTADAVMAALHATWISIAPAALPGATVLGCGTVGSAGGAGAGIGCAGSPTLPPGVYISATASTIGVTGNLTLDAAGNADAVWVFQAPSALTANVGSTIILSGGAKASNVWWYVGSDASVNGSSVFQGNILASASISLGSLATSCGRLLSGAAATAAGTLTMLANTVSVPGHPNAPVTCK